ncbi:hypothetical protein AYL99_10784 [Fonsecaea erecta]|uniref:Uncharacterized protein n=1 Tax=Fonsecaea erecta TaxID=1367422 RepID=A0A178Z5N8_9EURO|nr:hypothetical protein AYL99_10784 [Fonsecaea erecta]OAP55084.1 hypothetical protein AYL99_10784 [Fonsecaea erecta]
MVLSKLAQLPTLPSLRLTTTQRQTRSRASTSASLTDSATPSPTQSSLDTSTSAGGATSVSDPGDHADTLATNTNPVSSATMKPKATTSNKHSPSSTGRRFQPKVIDLRDRRASSRVRKPTAKAQALGSRRYASPPPLLDTIIIEHTPPNFDLSPLKAPSTTSTLPKDAPEAAYPTLEVPSNPPTADPKPAKPPSSPPPQVGGEEAPHDVPETPSRRTSRRERKPTAKLLSDSGTAQKRPATEDVPDAAPPRKSARLSYSAARIPSKLRYSISANNSEADDAAAEAEKPPSPAVPSPKKSKVIVLKSKRLAEVFGPPKPRQENKSPGSKGKSKRRSHPSAVNTKGSTTQPHAAPVDIPGSCNLLCLSTSSRLLAFARIAREMPNAEDENEETIPGSVYDWRMYTQVWCQCAQFEQPKPGGTDPVELERALMPNPVSEGTNYDSIDLTTERTPDAELLSVPVNTILRASDSQQLSQLYTGSPSQSADQIPLNGTPATNGMRTEDSHRHAETHGPFCDEPSRNNTLYSRTPSIATIPTYEERLRDDHTALTEIRQMATARRLSWSFNMTFDEIQAMVREAEDREQQARQPTLYRQIASRPQNGIARANGHSEPHSRLRSTGFGVLLPPQASHQARRVASGRNWLKAGLTPPAVVNGEGDAAQERVTSNPTPPTPGSVEESTPAKPCGIYRTSSSLRPKSSRFRVDPRGLRGESPGPGTIINMKGPGGAAAEAKRATEGHANTGKSTKEFEEHQEREDGEKQKRRHRKEQEGHKLNGHGHGHGHGQP